MVGSQQNTNRSINSNLIPKGHAKNKKAVQSHPKQLIITNLTFLYIHAYLIVRGRYNNRQQLLSQSVTYEIR
jgi:hypothetical protein